jgi:hypothetical protein
MLKTVRKSDYLLTKFFSYKCRISWILETKKNQTWNVEEFYPQAGIKYYNEVCDSFLEVVQPYSCIFGAIAKNNL